MDLDVERDLEGQQERCEISPIRESVSGGCSLIPDPVSGGCSPVRDPLSGASSPVRDPVSVASSSIRNSGESSPTPDPVSGASSPVRDPVSVASSSIRNSGASSPTPDPVSGASSPTPDPVSGASSSIRDPVSGASSPMVDLEGGEDSPTVDLEKSPEYYQKPGTSTESTGIDLNLYSGDGDPKEIEKTAAPVEIHAASAAVPMPAGFPVDGNVAQMASKAVFAASSRLLDEAPNQESSEASERELEPVNPSSVTTASCYSVAELHRVARKAHESVERAREYVVYCRKFIRALDESVRVLSEFAGYFQDKSRNESPGNFNYVTLAEQYGESAEIVREKSEKLVEVVRAMEGAAVLADESAADAERKWFIDPGRVHFRAVGSEVKVRKLWVHSHSVEYSALKAMKKIAMELEESSHLLDISSGTISSEEYSQECENRERKTRVAHAVALVIGISLTAATFLLFKKGSDSFYAILCLGTLTTGWSVLYWSIKLYKCLKSRFGKLDVEADVPDFLDNVGERLNYLKEFLQRRNALPPSDSDELEQ